MNERELRRIVSQDFSVGTEAFRDALLARCLEVLGEDGAAAELGDEELELLAAAGDMSATGGPFWDNGGANR